MRINKFYKEDGKWYLYLPFWIFDKKHLQMLCGADKLLDILSDNGNSVILKHSTVGFEGYDEKLNRLYIDGIFGGAYYETKHNKLKNKELWLCVVTLLLFFRYPKEIYIQKI